MHEYRNNVSLKNLLCLNEMSVLFDIFLSVYLYKIFLLVMEIGGGGKVGGRRVNV